MKILIVTIFYAPDGGPSAPLFAMLSEELVRHGHDVTVVAAVPHYPGGQVRPEYRNGWRQETIEQDVRVIRVRVPSVDRARLSRRLLQFITYQVNATLVGLGEQYDVLLVTNPALITIVPFLTLSTLRRKPTGFSVHDVYPEVGINLGVFRHKLVVDVVGALERYCLNNSRYVRVLSTSFVPTLEGMGVPTDKIALIYDWINTDFVSPQPRDNPFSTEHNLNDKFVILYAGNIGLSQGLDHALEAARLLAEYPEIQFVFVGEGAGRAPLMAQAEELNLTNVRFIPFQPRERVPEVLATADAALVSLQPQVGARSLPSKTISYLASGRPILAVVDEGSDTWNLVERAQAGLCVPPGQPEKLAEAVLTLRSAPDLCQQMGNAGRTYAEEHHSHHQAARQFLALLEQAAAQG